MRVSFIVEMFNRYFRIDVYNYTGKLMWGIKKDSSVLEIYIIPKLMLWITYSKRL